MEIEEEETPHNLQETDVPVGGFGEEVVGLKMRRGEDEERRLSQELKELEVEWEKYVGDNEVCLSKD